MSRYLLDTNIVVFILFSEFDKLSIEPKKIVDEYNNQLFTSAISVMELMQLFRLKKIKSKKYKNSTELFNAIENEFFIKILPFSKNQSFVLSQLNIAPAHSDPFDHAIISHAIADKLILISSDRKFDFYKNQKLLFLHNII